ncbi:sulfurtransferase complex subunit TusB [Neptunomonas japonica]|uniref:tRNA 2-thiouridine synthesizing protein B n=1 Tax=Neptunomonas japonica JAMM 1380 TaxID=1441457 RepID=A0A7R6PGS2_9GAMM|nr:sulfurtransferase complex subunit TusB [Neptunomonas japonica]BBB29318.1 tRNA 2-thiouridine synthesizing protein B [Neptunomonas japonica JAMM 1380]
MTTLHTINKPPSNAALWHSCIAALLPGDTLLIIENGVYAATHTIIAQQLSTLEEIDISFLSADLQARGLILADNNKISAVDDQQFVELACQHSKTVSWF